MLKPMARACDHCKKVIKPKTNYLKVDCAVHLDMPGVPGVVADSTRIAHEQKVELHGHCASEFFRNIAGWMPDADALPALPAPTAADEERRQLERDRQLSEARQLPKPKKPRALKAKHP